MVLAASAARYWRSDLTSCTEPSAARLHTLIEELDIHPDPQLLDLAFIHRSYAYENGQIPTNERLEFLGDAVLGVTVTDQLYRHFPDLPEGRLAKLRAAVVSSVSLASVARELGIGSLVKLGHGELTTGGRNKSSILADTTEAVIGAIFLTDPDGAARFVHRLFDPLLDHAASLGAGLDWKTSLQELSSQLGLGTPSYQITQSGPDHDKRFEATAVVGERRFVAGVGRSKKQAEQQAASNAFAALRSEAADPTTGEPPAGEVTAG